MKFDFNNLSENLVNEIKKYDVYDFVYVNKYCCNIILKTIVKGRFEFDFSYLPFILIENEKNHEIYCIENIYIKYHPFHFPSV